MIIEKAQMIGRKLNVANMSFYRGWLRRFKARNGIKRYKLQGEAGSINTEDFQLSIEDVKQKLRMAHPDDIYNLDETSLFYKLGPSATLATRPIKGRKKCKDRITLCLITNASGGNMRKPVVVGRHENPRCFKNVDKELLGVQYFHNAKAWMTMAVFSAILEKWDKELLEAGRHVLLLLDNATGHKTLPGVILTNIVLILLPPNCTSMHQPLDAGIIAALKVRYRSKVARLHLAHLRNKTDFNIDLLSAIRLIVEAWKEISPVTISNCWKHSQVLAFNSYFSANYDNIICDGEAPPEFTDGHLHEYVNFTEPNEADLSDLLCESETEEENDEVCANSCALVSKEEATKSIDTVISFFRQQIRDREPLVKPLLDLKNFIVEKT